VRHLGHLCEIVHRLPKCELLPHFTVHYGLRNASSGPGLGANGVRDMRIVRTYCKALEEVHRVLTSPIFGRLPLSTDERLKVPVYILDVSELLQDSGPFTGVAKDGRPYICLPSRSDAPTTGEELRRAAAEAVHEATHVFNLRDRPFLDPVTGFPDQNTAKWEWFDEGLAVFMEQKTLPKNPDFLRFVMDWIDHPDESLDGVTSHYQAVMFVSYLASRFGCDLLRDVWTGAAPNDDPISSINRALAKYGLTFASGTSPDLFCSGYCVDSYFLWSSARSLFPTTVHPRYGERALVESIGLSIGPPIQRDGTLDYLSCQYFRFYLEGGRRFAVRVRAPASAPFGPFRAYLVPVLKNREPDTPVELTRKDMGKLGQQLSGELQTTKQRDCPIDHVLLVVANYAERTTYTQAPTSSGGWRYELDAELT
jgi:hypothetical protein